MRLRPTLRASHLSALGIAVVGVGVISTHALMTAYGSAMLLGVALSHALTRVSVARARAAGFEMLWLCKEPVRRASRTHEIVIEAELRNRDNLPTRFQDLKVSHSSALTINCSPAEGDVPARGSLRLTLRVTGRRVGFHGIHNITLQTVRAPGLYTVPLSFSNPFVVEVLPSSFQLGLAGAAGGRSGGYSPRSKKGLRSGDGSELREIREHRPGDPYRRIAWKPSARRGRLLIIEKEQEQSDTVWVIVGASIESASGEAGNSALDRSIDSAARTASEHLARGDRVGLAIIGLRTLAKLPPAHGSRQKAKILSALTLKTHCADSDRSDWDAADVARKVIEHAGSLDARASTLHAYDYEGICHLANELVKKAPVDTEAPWSGSRSDKILRHYLLSFGIQPPPRGMSDRHRSENQLAEELSNLVRSRKKPSLVYVYSAPPSHDSAPALLKSFSALVKSRVATRFVPALEPTIDLLQDSSDHPDNLKSTIVKDALACRQRIASEDGLRKLRILGVKVVQPKRQQNLRRRLAFFSKGTGEQPTQREP